MKELQQAIRGFHSDLARINQLIARVRTFAVFGCLLVCHSVAFVLVEPVCAAA